MAREYVRDEDGKFAKSASADRGVRSEKTSRVASRLGAEAGRVHDVTSKGYAMQLASRAEGAFSDRTSDARYSEMEAALVSGADQKQAVVEGGTPVAAIAWSKGGRDGNVFIDHVGSLKPGAGRQLVERVLEYADKTGKAVTLVSSNVARSFWDGLGFRPSGRGDQLIREPKKR